MQPKIPKWHKGQVLTAADLTTLSEAIGRSINLVGDATSGIEVGETKSARYFTRQDQPVATWAIVTTAITAFSGTTFGSGMIRTGYMDDNNKFVLHGTDPEPCYNSTLTAIPASSTVVIQAKWIDGDWAVDVVPCSGGTS